MTTSIHECAISSLAVIDNTKYTLTGGKNDGMIKLCHYDTQTITAFPRQHYGAITAIAVNSDQSCVVSGSNGKHLSSLTTWDLVKQTATRSFKGTNNGVVDAITDCRYINNDVIMSSGENNYINLYDTRALGPLTKPIFSTKTSRDVLTSLDVYGHNVFASSYDGNVYQMDVKGEKMVASEFDASVVDFKVMDQTLAVVVLQSGTLAVYNYVAREIVDAVRFSGYLEHVVRCDFWVDYYDEKVYHIAVGGDKTVVYRYSKEGIRTEKELGEGMNVVRFNYKFNEMVGVVGGGMRVERNVV